MTFDVLEKLRLKRWDISVGVRRSVSINPQRSKPSLIDMPCILINSTSHSNIALFMSLILIKVSMYAAVYIDHKVIILFEKSLRLAIFVK